MERGGLPGLCDLRDGTVRFQARRIQQVMMELHEIFDYTTLEEARAYYERSPY